jgi:hypothetical protein
MIVRGLPNVVAVSDHDAVGRGRQRTMIRRRRVLVVELLQILLLMIV